MSKEDLKTVELGYGERMVLRRLLQAERGNEITADVVDWFIRDLGLSEEEVEDCRDKEILLEMSPKAFNFSRWREKTVVKLLKATAAAGNLGQEQITLYHKFVPSVVATPEDEELAEEYAAMLAAKAKQEAPSADSANAAIAARDNHVPAAEAIAAL